MTLSKEKIEYFKSRLESERDSLEENLSGVGQKNTDLPGDWEPTHAVLDVSSSDENEKADEVEEFENRVAIEENLEESLILVKEALESIKNGDYGICSNCGKPINEKRLEALPWARKCVDCS